MAHPDHRMALNRALDRHRAGCAAALGFTLVEVMVAVAIMAVMATTAWQGVEAMARAKSAAETRLERVLALNTALGQWSADLRAAHETPWVPALGFDGNTLRVIRQTPGGLQVVAWTLRDGAWRRWSSPETTRRGELQEWWIRSQSLEAGAQDPRVQEIAAVPGMLGWQLYYFRNNAWSSPQSSDADQAAAPVTLQPGTGGGVTPAPGRGQASIPEGVRLVLTFSASAAAGTPGSLSGQVVHDLVLRRSAGP